LRFIEQNRLRPVLGRILNNRPDDGAEPGHPLRPGRRGHSSISHRLWQCGRVKSYCGRCRSTFVRGRKNLVGGEAAPPGKSVVAVATTEGWSARAASESLLPPRLPYGDKPLAIPWEPVRIFAISWLDTVGRAGTD
jgi:hypothetical protein